MVFPQDIDLDDLTAFFSDHKDAAMPRDLLSMVLSGVRVQSDGLETGTMEWRDLRELFAPDLAQKITVGGEGYPIPYVRKHLGPDYFIYDPTSGAYVGGFNIIDAEAAIFGRLADQSKK